VDFLSAMLHSLQLANWQRGGGKGEKPKAVKRPMETKPGRNRPVSRDELAARRQKLAAAQERTRQRKAARDAH
jgi:hypothetical protein